MNIGHKAKSQGVCPIAKVEFSMSGYAVYSNGLALQRIKACGIEGNFLYILSGDE